MAVAAPPMSTAAAAAAAAAAAPGAPAPAAAVGVPRLGAPGVAWRLWVFPRLPTAHEFYQRTFDRHHIPLVLSYGMTVNRSQGIDLEAAVVAVHTFFDCAQLYTALSRCKRRSTLHILWRAPGGASPLPNVPDRTKLGSWKPRRDALNFYRRLNGDDVEEDMSAAASMLGVLLMGENAKLDRAGLTVRLQQPPGAVRLGELKLTAPEAEARRVGKKRRHAQANADDSSSDVERP